MVKYIGYTLITTMLILLCLLLFALLYPAKPTRYFIRPNYISDNINSISLETDGQSMKTDYPNIYSYGKSGFMCLNENSDKIIVLIDENTMESKIKIWEGARKNRYKDNLIILYKRDELSEKQKQIYDELKSMHNQFRIRG